MGNSIVCAVPGGYTLVQSGNKVSQRESDSRHSLAQALGTLCGLLSPGTWHRRRTLSTSTSVLISVKVAMKAAIDQQGGGLAG